MWVMNKTYNVEYEEAPSGNVTFYNYKEPLMKFDEGHGYVGALIYDGTSGKIQCHFCGEWFDALGNHINKEHALKAIDYKRIVGLNKSTALINEKFRASLIAHGTRNQNLVSQKGKTRSLETRRMISETLKENREEKKNLAGTCPAQLLDRLSKLYQKLGRTPTHKEIGFKEALKMTYGSIEEAMRLTGIPHRTPGQTINDKTKWTYKRCCEEVRKFYDENGRMPKTIDQKKIGAGLCSRIHFYGTRKVFADAMILNGKYGNGLKNFRYSKEELLNLLRSFEKINGRKPSTSDCKRKLLPHASRYIYNFGSWKNALSAAFIETHEKGIDIEGVAFPDGKEALVGSI